MNKNIILTFSLASLLLCASCSSKMGALSPNLFTVTPKPLETQGGHVTAAIDGTFPEKYFDRKATVTIVPELRYDGQAAQASAASFQGEKVMGNNQTINYRLGGRFTMLADFPYNDLMRNSDLYLTFKGTKGNKTFTIPAVKIGEGVIATSELYKKTMISDGALIAPDSFQHVRTNKYDAEVKFLINQANLRQSELKNNSVKEFVALLKRINADRERLNIKNVEVNAYASPEGGVAFNEKLATQRQNTSEDYVKQQLKSARLGTTDVDAHYTAQDWEGFRQLVAASNIQDKDVILRVLSMYKDPEEREQQIRNMSEGFRELATGILPELRRSRMTINYEAIGRSDDEIKAQYESDPTKLSPEELLYMASTLEENPSKKAEVYQTAAKLYDRDYRPLNNLAALAFDRGDYAEAENYLRKAEALNPSGGEVYGNEGLIALRQGDLSKAETLIAKASKAGNASQAVGLLQIAKGDAVAASRTLEGQKTNTAALASILAKDYDTAAKQLDGVEHPDALNCYLHAIVAARRGNAYATQSYLEEAYKKDASFKDYAEKDLEFAKYRK